VIADGNGQTEKTTMTSNVKPLPFQERIKRLVKEREDFEQMKADARFRSKFQDLIVDEGFD
jgi:hypothetical protein